MRVELLTDIKMGDLIGAGSVLDLSDYQAQDLIHHNQAKAAQPGAEPKIVSPRHFGTEVPQPESPVAPSPTVAVVPTEETSGKPEPEMNPVEDEKKEGEGDPEAPGPAPEGEQKQPEPGQGG